MDIPFCLILKINSSYTTPLKYIEILHEVVSCCQKPDESRQRDQSNLIPEYSGHITKK